MTVDPVTAAAAVALVVPYLTKAGEAAAEKIGEASVDAAGKVMGWLRTKLTGNAREALADLEQAPEDPDNQADLRKQLAKTLKAHPDLAEELLSMLPPEALDSGAMTQTIIGAGAKGLQIRGSNNRIG